MARIDGVNPDQVQDDYIARVLDAQSKKWGAPLLNHLIYARRPGLFRGMRGMWTAIGGVSLIPGTLQALVNRRVAAINGCEF